MPHGFVVFSLCRAARAGCGGAGIYLRENLWINTINPHNVLKSLVYWRMGWDSNPRCPCGHAGFQDRCLKPLGHPSFAIITTTCLTRTRAFRGPWTKSGPNLPAHPFRHGADDRYCSRIGFFGAAGVDAKQDCRVVPTPRRYDVDRDAGIEQQRLVCSAEIVKPKSGKAECLRPACKHFADVARIPRLGRIEAFTFGRRGREQQCVLRHLNKRDVDHIAVLCDAGGKEKTISALRGQDGSEVVVDRDGAGATWGLRLLEAPAILRLLKRAGDRHR